MEKCTFCGRESDTAKTKVIGGYTILEHCTDCEHAILATQRYDDPDETE